MDACLRLSFCRLRSAFATLSPVYIEDADQTDLASYLYSRGESLKRCGRQYLWEKHQVWISGNRWYTHYDSVGGYAVRFVMRYFNLDFPHAVADLLGDQGCVIAEEPLKADTLALPKPNQTMNQVFAYLIEKRFIARDVVHYFAHKGTLYEDAQYHNCIFVGLDEESIPRHVHRRSTRDSFKQTLAGSQAEYSFHHDGPGEWLFVFEAPIDMLAFITRHPKNWTGQSYVALCSVSEKALLHRLEVNPRLRKIVLCLDNDNAGAAASERIKALLNSKGYSDVRILKPFNKDWDEDCKADNGIAPIPAEANHAEQIILKCRDLFEKIEQTPRPTMPDNAVRKAERFVSGSGQPSLAESGRAFSDLSDLAGQGGIPQIKVTGRMEPVVRESLLLLCSLLRQR